MRRYRLFQVDAFASEPFQGNPAGVVLDADGLTDAQMQAIARELNNSETAFVLQPDRADHDVRVRFFTPTTEVPSCGHATIAAHHVLAVHRDLPSCTVRQRTGAGVLPVTVSREDTGGGYRITMTQRRPVFGPPLREDTVGDILAAMGLNAGELDHRCPLEIVSTGHSKVIGGITRRETIDALQPDLQRLTALSHAIDCNGYFVFTMDTEADEKALTYGRMFGPAIGIAEDPVTGNAHGPLGAYLIRHGLLRPTNGSASFSGRQGDAVGRPGVVEVDVDMDGSEPGVVRVTGRATIVFESELLV